MHHSHVKTSAQCLTKTEISSSKDLKSRNISKLDYGYPVRNFLASSFSMVFGCMAEKLSNYSTLISGLQSISRDTDNDAAMYKYCWWMNKRS